MGMVTARRAQAEVSPGSWRLPRNDVWNVPDEVSVVHLDLTTVGPWSVISGARALVVDFMGRVYGVRSLQDIQQDSYVLRGRVSVMGRKVRAFTGSRLFQREDKSLVDVAVFLIESQPPFDNVNEIMEAAQC